MLHTLIAWTYMVAVMSIAMFLTSCIQKQRIIQAVQFLLFIAIIVAQIAVTSTESDVRSLFGPQQSVGYWFLLMFFPNVGYTYALETVIRAIGVTIYEPLGDGQTREWRLYQQVAMPEIQENQRKVEYYAYNSASCNVTHMLSNDSSLSYTVGNFSSRISTYEDQQKRYTYETECVVADYPSVAEMLLSMWLFSFVYVLLAWYFAQVAGGGMTERWYFPFSLTYWVPRSKKIFETGDSLGALQAQSEREKSIVVHKLSKNYANSNAVTELSLGMVPNNLFCLLGQNGAGKSTTIGMLSGLILPSHGEAFILGYSIRTHMRNIQHYMGVCPQDDILFENLTGLQNMIFWCRFRGVANARDHIRELITGVDLLSAQHKKAGAYSGGMKRRLSVACSAVGKPKILFLDEPTTGMDPHSRRKVWNTIRSLKQDSVVIMTTHSMEEADHLGDRIAIIANGRLRALGTAMQLKEQYGTGFYVNMNVVPAQREAVLERMRKMLPTAETSVNAGATITFGVPKSCVRLLPDVFRKLEEDQEARGTETGVVDWSVSHTTLEEVFLRIAVSNKVVNADLEKKDVLLCVVCDAREAECVTLYTKAEIPVLVDGVCCTPCAEGTPEAPAPTAEDVAALAAAASASAESPLDDPEQDAPHADPAQDAAIGANSRVSEVAVAVEPECLATMSRGIPSAVGQMRALFLKSATLQGKQRKMNICRFLCLVMLLLCVVVVDWLLGAINGPRVTCPEAARGTYTIDGGYRKPEEFCFAEKVANRTCCESWEGDYSSQWQQPCSSSYCNLADKSGLRYEEYSSTPLLVWYHETSSLPQVVNLSDAPNSTSSGIQLRSRFEASVRLVGDLTNFTDHGEWYDEQVPSLFDRPYPDIAYSVSSEGSFVKVAVAVVPPLAGNHWEGPSYMYTTWQQCEPGIDWCNYMNTGPMRQEQLYALVHRIYGVAGADIVAMPELNFGSKQRGAPHVNGLWILIIILPILTMIFFPVMVSQVASEHVEKLVVMMRVHSMKLRYYWASVYCWYFLLYLIVMVLYTIVAAVLLSPTFHYGWYIMLTLLWGHAQCGCAVLLAAVLLRSDFLTICSYMFVLLSALVAFVCQMLGATTWPTGVFFIPSIAFVRGYILLWTNGDPFDVPEFRVCLASLVGIGTLALVLGLLILFAVGDDMSPLQEKWEMYLAKRMIGKVVASADINGEEDGDVVDERNRVINHVGPVDAVCVEGVGKQYTGGTLAVKHLTFGVPSGECFGLLGANGAGKTSTIAMMSGTSLLTYGKIRIAGHDVSTHRKDATQALGVCPQFDFVFDELTVEEHMLLYARLKGVPRRTERFLVRNVAAMVGLDGDAYHKTASSLSGGMRRRLMISLAMLTLPEVVLLDEPTTGTDPETRRDVWNALLALKKGRAMILTTHAMDEADALTDRIGIMASGSLKCVGTALHLKEKFGAGYRIKLATRNHKAVVAFVKNMVSDSEILKEQDELLEMGLPGGRSLLPKIFDMMEKHKRVLKITEWSCCQTSLDEVFNRIAEDAIAKEVQTTEKC